MKKALCVGINDYPGSSNDLNGCVNDANDWSNLLKSFGFETEVLLNSQAKSDTILTKLDHLITGAQAGDVVAFTYSGHGTQIMDTGGDEADGYDEALYVFDGTLPDDELRNILQKTKEGVHVAVISDSCFSGTVTRVVSQDTQAKPRFMVTDSIPPGTPLKKAFLSESGMKEILISGCSDSEYSYDAFINGRYNGAFTANAVSLLKQGQTYNEFYTLLRTKLPSSSYPQTPQLEGTNENKARLVFETVTELPGDDEPGEEPGTGGDAGQSWFSKYWWVIAAGVLAGLYYLLK